LDHKHEQKRKKQPKSKFQIFFEEFELSHFAVSGPYFIPRRVIQDCMNGLYIDYRRRKMTTIARSLEKAYKFGVKHPNVWHPKNGVLLPNIRLCPNKNIGMYYSRNLHIWTNMPLTPEKGSLVVCNVGKRSFFMVWNES
jgi:hypothetical protein